ncbi:hypothetical protein GCM10020295_53050 [Streptomyces cinereospinus]
MVGGVPVRGGDAEHETLAGAEGVGGEVRVGDGVGGGGGGEGVEEGVEDVEKGGEGEGEGERGGVGEGRADVGRTTRDSSSSAWRASSAGARPAVAIRPPSGPYSAVQPPTRWASCRRTEGTGSGRAAAAARLRWASVTRRSSACRARAVSCQTARATPEKVVRGGTSSSGRPYASQAPTSAGGTVSCTGATPKPRAAPPAATIRET